MSSRSTAKGKRKPTCDSSEVPRRKTHFIPHNKRAKTTSIVATVGSSEDSKVDISDSVCVPKFLTDFYRHAQSLRPEDPHSAFNELKSARLVGLFELLSGDLSSLSEDDLLLHYRHATDLPEMQTILLCDVGRYCLWRDVPNSEEGLIVYASTDDRFPKIEVVGNRVEHAIVHLATKAKKAVEPFLPKSVDVAVMRQQMETVCKQRNRKKLGKAPSGAGLWVQMVNDIGYRPISEDTGKIKKTLDLICNTNDEQLRQSKMQWLMELVTFAQIANDECDFGMGLELGQWLFLANHELLDRLAHRLLATAYLLLGRAEYKRILDVQMASGVRRRKELDARKRCSA